MANDQVAPPEPLSSEAAALAAILRWSINSPAWQQDALRRLCTHGKLSAGDLDELLAVCKGETAAVPLQASDIRDPAAGGAVVTLVQLYGLENVNALAVGERLSFGKVGLTVIYGDNGAGKSGYARVLKQLCRARSPKGDVILSNIYSANAGLPKANIDFAVGGQKRSVAWTQGGPSDPMLSAVSVFDSRTANVHVDATNDLAYTPLPLQVLGALAQACQELKAKLAAEAEALLEQTPAVLTTPECRPFTAVGKLIASLSPRTTPEQVNELAGLTPEEEERLQVLQSDLGSDPGRLARQLQASLVELGSLEERLGRLANPPRRRIGRGSNVRYADARPQPLAESESHSPPRWCTLQEC